MFFYLNILYLPDLVNTGELDLLLSKPINSLFIVSLRRHQLYEISTFLSGIVILIYSQAINRVSWGYIFLLVPVGLVALFSVMLILASPSFFVPHLSALGSIWDVLSKTARFPLDIFTGSSRLALSLMAPLLLIVTPPSQLVLGKVGWWAWAPQLLGAAVLFLISYKFWIFSLRHYSSASS